MKVAEGDGHKAVPKPHAGKPANAWSRSAHNVLIALALWLSVISTAPALAAPVKLVEQDPISITKLPGGDYLLDYGRVAFGNLLITPPASERASITVRLGEAMRSGRVDRTPPGAVRYAEVTVALDGRPIVVATRPDLRNTRPPAVLTPADQGVLVPFRWAEIRGWPGELKPADVRRRALFDATWDDQAASFQSSDPMLNRVWDLCHYSIKATTFAGIFVDGDRERLAYEADAYLEQLSYYAGDPSSQMERDTFERLIEHPTWPTEWAPHMVFLAYTDWMQTGDQVWLAKHYDWLKTKLLLERVQADGLVHSNAAQVGHNDIVDWPAGERDGYVFTPINTVVNAFYLHALAQMGDLAHALGRRDDEEEMGRRLKTGLASFQRTLFNEQTGLYRDGAGTEHSSLHANLFPLAFGVVPEDKRAHVADWLAHRGMRGSVYAAQYLLEGLFENGQSTAAIEEMIAPGDRSWRHMVDSGATITWEAWDLRYKPNDDWTHAWGAAPANLLPRYVLGVQVSKPGWIEASLEPHPGALHFANGTVPTPRGAVRINWARNATFTFSAQLPPGMRATVRLPATDNSRGIWKNGRLARAYRDGNSWVLSDPVSDNVSLEVR